MTAAPFPFLPGASTRPDTTLALPRGPQPRAAVCHILIRGEPDYPQGGVDVFRPHGQPSPCSPHFYFPPCSYKFRHLLSLSSPPTNHFLCKTTQSWLVVLRNKLTRSCVLTSISLRSRQFTCSTVQEQHSCPSRNNLSANGSKQPMSRHLNNAHARRGGLRG